MKTASSKSRADRAQEIMGVTRNELKVATLVLAILFASLMYKWIANPEDPLDQKLNESIKHILDSAARAKSLADSLASISPPDSISTNQLPSRSNSKRKLPPKQKVNLTNASKGQLMLLPGVGEVMAEHILNYRSTHNFKRVRDLMNVPGIGRKKFEKIEPYVEVR